MERTFSFEVAMSPEEAAAHLHEAVRFRWKGKPQHVLGGKVRGFDFKLHYVKLVWYGTAKPVLRGRIEPRRNRTYVSGRVGRGHEYKSIVFLFAMMLAFVVTELSRGNLESARSFALIGGGMFAVIYPLDRWLFGRYAPRAINGLRAIFADATAPPTAAS